MKSAIVDAVIVVAAVTVFFFANTWRLNRRDRRTQRQTRDRYIGRS
jgi:hypothetical protein